MHMVSRTETSESEWAWFEATSCWLDLMIGTPNHKPWSFSHYLSLLNQLVVDFVEGLPQVHDRGGLARASSILAVAHNGNTLSVFWSGAGAYAEHKYRFMDTFSSLEDPSTIAAIHYVGSPFGLPQVASFALPGGLPPPIRSALVA